MTPRTIRALIERRIVRILDDNRAFARKHPLIREMRDENRRLYRYLRTLA